MTQTLAPATLPGAPAAAAERASRRILAGLLPVRPPRHRQRRAKTRPQFPAAGGRRVPASTGLAEITIWHAGQITPRRRAHPASRPQLRHVIAGGKPAPATRKEENRTRPVEPVPGPARHPGCRHPCQHKRNSQAGINRHDNPMHPNNCLTPKAMALGR